MRLIKIEKYLLILVMQYIYYRLDSNYIAYLIEGKWSICILLLFVIWFNPSKFLCALVQSPDVWRQFHLSIPGLFHRVLLTYPHIHLFLCYALIFYYIFYMCAVYGFYFQVSYFCLSIFVYAPDSSPLSNKWGI